LTAASRRCASGQFPSPADGWLLQLTPDAGRLLAPDGTIAYRGGVDFPGPWHDLARRGDACVVLAGTIGLRSCPGHQLTVQDLRRLLNQAARAGELAGALVRTRDA
jgi:hypothetical protein